MAQQTKMTNFKKVQEFNTLFDVERLNKHNPNVFTEKKDLVEFRMSLIREEMRELEEAVKDGDYTETRDALADILYVVYGMQDCLGIDGDDDFRLVHDSNMSKACENETDAVETVASYKTKYVNNDKKYDSPYYYYVEGSDKWVIKNKSTGKVLKSLKYKPVDLTDLSYGVDNMNLNGK